jgi:hypothetical protein
MTILSTCQMRCSRDNDEIWRGCIERAWVSSEFRIARNSVGNGANPIRNRGIHINLGNPLLRRIFSLDDAYSARTSFSSKEQGLYS